MVPKLAVRCKRSPSEIRELVTKFGGQPVWLNEPQWPLSKRLNTPMMFIGQVLLEPEIFGPTIGRIAYIFMTDDVTGDLPTWDPAEGENAVVVQPGKFGLNHSNEPVGPTLVTPVNQWWKFSGRSSFEVLEYAAHVSRSFDPEIAHPAKGMGENTDAASFQQRLGNKVGGIPAWIGEELVPELSDWRLLLQLEADRPVRVYFGDAGVGFAFLNRAGDEGKFMWQSH